MDWFFLHKLSCFLVAGGVRPSEANPASGAPGWLGGPTPARLSPFIDMDKVWIGFSSTSCRVFLLLDLRQAMNIMTATMTQTTIAVEAGMMMLSSLIFSPTPS